MARLSSCAVLLAWSFGGLAACVPAAPPPPTMPGGNAERGLALLAQYQCGSCHTIPGVPASRGKVAAPLERFGIRSYIAGRLPNHPETLVRWIVAPESLVPGTAMPSMGVTPEDARDMAAYLLAQR